MVIPRLARLVTLFLVVVLSSVAWADERIAGDEPKDGKPSSAFDFESVAKKAAELARTDYLPDHPDLPDYLANLDADKYREIVFNPNAAIWSREGLPFGVELAPRGFLYKDRVMVNLVADGTATPVLFRRELFNFGTTLVPQEMPVDLGYSGLRLTYPLSSDQDFTEIASFQGASYFRVLANGLGYGLSARGLAIDTGLPSKEEFPVFREFWLVKPKKDDKAITLYALLDSESVAGAYRFVFRPGSETVVDVKNRLFFRKSVRKLGVAPLTSMFFHGEDTDRFVDDYRPEAHDSDGLLVETGYGERIWRPLVNPLGLRVSGFQVENPKSFGLFQRDRDFRNYQDLTAGYQLKPSAIVEPIGKWGKGMVELVEIPSSADRYDNIGAYWVPEEPISSGQEAEYEYRLHFSRDPEVKMLGGRVISTRIGAGGEDLGDPEKRKFVVDFVGDSLSRLAPDTSIEAVFATTSGKVSPPRVERNPHNDGWRLTFELKPDGDTPADLRAFLRRGPDVLSETWSFRWVKEQ